jgi:hypothetical protein
MPDTSTVKREAATRPAVDDQAIGERRGGGWREREKERERERAAVFPHGDVNVDSYTNNPSRIYTDYQINQ